MIRRFLPLLPLIFILLLLEILVRAAVLPSFLVPAPSDVGTALFSESADLWRAFGSTLTSALFGFLLAAFLGVGLGVLLSTARWIQDAFYPYAVFFQTVPIIAIAPLLVIWIGYGRSTVVASTLIVSIFPMIASTLAGIQSTDLALRELFRLYRSSTFDHFWKLRLPAALPQIFVGLRISAGLAVIGAIVGEFIAGGGLGGIIDVARTRQRVDQMFAALLLASLIGLLFVGIINGLSRLLLKHWHPSQSPLAK